jgi:hypothetical protein
VDNGALVPERGLREEIVKVLRRDDGARLSATPKWIARQIAVPVRAVREELDMMRLHGVTRSKVLRSGEVLYSLRGADRLVLNLN